MPIDWTAVIERGRADLARFAAMLSERVSAQISRVECFAAQRQLRPLESALRRLITIFARGLIVAPRASGAFPAGGIPQTDAPRLGAFPLFDPRKRVGIWARSAPGPGPRIRGFDEGPAAAEPEADPAAEIERLRARMDRAVRALGRLPEEARRLARWRLRHPCSVKQPMRPGRAPGFIGRARQDVIQVTLADLDLSARIALEPD